MWERPLSISTTAIVLTASCGPGCIGERLIWVGAQIRQRAPFKIVECMRRSILEWIIGDEAIADIVLLALSRFAFSRPAANSENSKANSRNQWIRYA